MDTVTKAIQEFQTAIAGVQRIAGQDIGAIKEAFNQLDSGRVARERLTRELRDFLMRLGGGILPLDGSTLARPIHS